MRGKFAGLVCSCARLCGFWGGKGGCPTLPLPFISLSTQTRKYARALSAPRTCDVFLQRPLHLPFSPQPRLRSKRALVAV